MGFDTRGKVSLSMMAVEDRRKTPDPVAPLVNAGGRSTPTPAHSRVAPAKP